MDHQWTQNKSIGAPKSPWLHLPALGKWLTRLHYNILLSRCEVLVSIWHTLLSSGLGEGKKRTATQSPQGWYFSTQYYHYFREYGTQRIVKHTHKTISVFYICPGQSIPIHSKLYTLLSPVFLFLSFFSKMTLVLGWEESLNTSLSLIDATPFSRLNKPKHHHTRL